MNSIYWPALLFLQHLLDQGHHTLYQYMVEHQPKSLQCHLLLQVHRPPFNNEPHPVFVE